MRNNTAQKLLDFIGGLITIILFDGFLLWALFIAPCA